MMQTAEKNRARFARVLVSITLVIMHEAKNFRARFARLLLYIAFVMMYNTKKCRARFARVLLWITLVIMHKAKKFRARFARIFLWITYLSWCRNINKNSGSLPSPCIVHYSGRDLETKNNLKERCSRSSLHCWYFTSFIAVCFPKPYGI